jgi:hypothetical protein
MCTQILNTVGLSLNIVGVAVLFWRAFPQPSFEEDAGVGLEDNTRLPGGKTVAQQRDQTRAQRTSYACWARFGLGLLVAGWLFQLWATWVA